VNQLQNRIGSAYKEISKEK